MPDCLDSSPSIPLAKTSVQSSGTCATFLKRICADNHWLGLRWEHLLHFLDPLPRILCIFCFDALYVLYFSSDFFFCSPFLARGGCLHLICWALTVHSHLLVPWLFLCCCSWSNFFMWRFGRLRVPLRFVGTSCCAAYACRSIHKSLFVRK